MRRSIFSWRKACIFLLSLMSLEAGLRLVGFADTPIMISDPKIEYYAQPNRCYNRYGNKICYNKLGMRSDEYSQSIDNTILIVGDSVANGGALTDQRNTISDTLKRIYYENGIQINSMNASAGSWGPRNQLEFLKRFMLFKADHAVIIVSSHDITDIPDFNEPVRDDRKADFAIFEMFDRVFIENIWRISQNRSPEIAPTTRDRNMGMNDYRELVNFLCLNSKKVTILMHPNQNEMSTGMYEDYSFSGFIHSFDKNRCAINVVDMIIPLSKSKIETHRDKIHLNDFGNHIYARTIYKLQ